MSSGTDCILNGSWNHFPDSWWDHHTGNFHKNLGMRIDHLLVTGSLKHRVVCAEIDREARKGKPLPSDHAPLVIDIDNPGHSFDASWTSAESRIAARQPKQPTRPAANFLMRAFSFSPSLRG